ncbi:MAG: hypothetical protein GEV03_19625 [Streptosporangiales bacterium]|nr:hypothetical protein [Streptosporangiales bacterium]
MGSLRARSATPGLMVAPLLVLLMSGCGDRFIERDADLPSPERTAHEIQRLLPKVMEQLRAAGVTPETPEGAVGRFSRCPDRLNDEFPGDYAVAWRYEAHGDLDITTEDPRQLLARVEPDLERLGWTMRPTRGVNERRDFTGAVAEIEAEHDLLLMRIFLDRIEIKGPCVPTSEEEHEAYGAREHDTDRIPLSAQRWSPRGDAKP